MLRVARRTGAAPHRDQQRDCALYYIDVLDATTNYTTVRRNGYIGETARAPFTRFVEHLYEQPFGDIIVGAPRVDPRVFPDKESVWAAEREAVERLRPQYNHEWNLANPDRIPIPVAQRQRAARDAARGVTPWSAPGRTRRGSLSPRRRGRAVPGGQVLSPKWRRRRNTVAVRAAVWLVLTVVAAAAGVFWLALPVAVAPRAAGLLTAAGMTWTAPWWRRRRGLRKATCRALAVLLVVAAAVALAAAPVSHP